MTAHTFLTELLALGITPRLTADRKGIAIPRHALTEAQAAAVVAHKPQLLRLLRIVESPVTEARMARLLRLGLPLADAQATARRLAWRDATWADSRALCAECQHLSTKPWRCTQHRAAGLHHPELPSAMVTTTPHNCAASSAST